jgi:hypothetical protein
MGNETSTTQKTHQPEYHSTGGGVSEQNRLFETAKGHGAPPIENSNLWNISPEYQPSPQVHPGPKPRVSLKDLESHHHDHTQFNNSSHIQLENIMIEHSKPAHKTLTEDNMTADDMKSVNIPESKHTPTHDQDHLIKDHGPKYHVTQLDRFPDCTNPKVLQQLEKCGNYIYRKEFVQYGELPYLPPIRLENDCVYVGQWKNGKKHGKGKQLMADGALYEGYWEHDKGNRLGRLINGIGDIYEGQFLDDEAHGKGRFTHPDGSYYFGPWKNSHQCGLGTEENIVFDCDKELIETGKNINRYEGNFFEGDKHGNGRYFYANGEYYDGQWDKNDMNGEGSYVWADGRKYMGEWKDGKENGPGKFYWPDGREFNGNYHMGVKSGYGSF